MSNLIVRGALDAEPQKSSLEAHVSGAKLTPIYSGRPARDRAGATRHELAKASPDDIVELELEDGFKIWTRVEDLEKDFEPVAARGEATEPGEIPLYLQTAGPSRGIKGKFAIQAFRVLGVDLEGVGDAAAKAAAEKWVEGKLVHGLHRCTAKDAVTFDSLRPSKDGAPTLVFLHGTASSTHGSFGGLWEGGAAARIHGLLDRYNGQVLAFEHRTLTKSPIENALEVVRELATVLKAAGPVHLVSHSRGGLIGELLCRSMMDGRGAVTAAEIQRFTDLGRKEDAEALKELGKRLDSSPLNIERFVRVACPARGTTLASKRLDRYLSVILNAIGKIPWLQGSVTYDMAAELLLTVLKKKASPEDFPGLEAMMPDSPLVELLNDPLSRTRADLHILGGDLKGGGVWGRLKELATNLFYLEDHDLVVNTPSMFGGAPRTDAVHYWIDTGSDVTHFNYFKRDDTASRLVDGLLRPEPGGYRVQDKAPYEINQGDYQKRALGSIIPRQTVVLLPGTMGTQLKLGGNRIWLDILDLARGGLGRLERNTTAETDGLVADSYKKLVAYLAETHDVELFPYDWRKSIPEIVNSPSIRPADKQDTDIFHKAEGLRQRLERILDRTEPLNLPVRILAHSMGGLVVRGMLATDEGKRTWARMKKHPGSRFIMLGTPNGGSHAIAALLLGRDALVKKLALLDLTKSHSKLLKVIADFDGVLQLLPHGGSLDCYEPAVWDKLYQHDVPPAKRGIFSSDVATDKSAKLDWAKPSPKLLEEARGVRELIRKSPIDAARMIYVAGRAPQTACDIKVVEENKEGRQVVVLATARGDGRVPWATGIPEGLQNSTYYMDAVHGDLANSEPDFPALLDLLERGVTAKLPRTAPSTRAATDEVFELREEQVETYPSRGDLISLAMAGSLPTRTEKAPVPRVRVRVKHGNLARASSPVMVGHYESDTIVSAEGYLDRQLDGRLSELHRLDLYPGKLGTAVVELNEGPGAASSHPGAIVVGLGQVGDLTPGGLASTVSHGLRRYGAEKLAKESSRAAESRDGAKELRVTILLIGTGSGGLSLADSLQSILRGVNLANLKLDASDAGKRARIATVDIVELYEDRAIQALRTLLDLGRTGEFRESLNIQETLDEGGDGRFRAYFEESQDWWQRIRIQTVEEGLYEGALRFEAVTNRARADTFLRPTQQKLVQGFLKRAREASMSDAELSGTLFELLIPNAFKQYAPDRRNLALVLDEDSAKYPWELMHDRFDETARPLAVEAGMIRVLVTKDGRPGPLPANENTALVIGDPPTNYNKLPGAAAEARKVRQSLADAGVEVTALIEGEASPQAVVAALYARKYKIVHIAAHGMYEEPKTDECGAKKPAKAGVVLADDILLTPAELDQMRFVPDLVFLNCCHLGQMAGAKKQPEKVDHRFAANVATQFIRMGVRAVVAAGWEVDDAAATTFADAFYREMLAGMEFGDAVRIARDEVYRDFGRTNTWGAYQCYGDPGFRLRKPKNGASSDSKPSSSSELRIALENVAADAGSASTDRERRLKSELDALVKAASLPWLERADIMGAIGDAYGQLGAYEEAIEWFERSLPCEPARQRLRILERLVNFRARLAEALYSGRATSSNADLTPTALIQKAEKLSDLLQQLGETAERNSIRGSLYKRAAMITSGAKTRNNRLRQMAEAYDAGVKIARSRGARDVRYPLQNWLAAEIALGWALTDEERKAIPKNQAKETKTQIDLARAELRTQADSLTDEDCTFWDLATKADLLLLEALRDKKLVEQHEAILEAYEKVMRRGGSRRERLSVLETLRFFETIAAGLAGLEETKTTLAAMQAKLEGAAT